MNLLGVKCPKSLLAAVDLVYGAGDDCGDVVLWLLSCL